MKLYASPTSPYARLVRVVLAEKDVSEQVDTVWVNPWEDDPDLLAVNPFARVPALTEDDGTVITESVVIATYLDRRFPTPSLMPSDRLARLCHKLSLGQGLLDATTGVVSALRYGGASIEDTLVKRRKAAVDRAVPRLAEAGVGSPDQPDLGDLCVGVALAYLSFRMSEVDWRAAEPGLGEWLERLETRPSFSTTRPDV